MTTKTMTPERKDRHDEFLKLFDGIPGRRIDKIRIVAALLDCAENTVRLYLLKTGNVRVPTRQAITALRRGLA